MAVITTKKIIKRIGWIGYVSHDLDDGSWQFLELKESNLNPAEAAVISLEEIIKIDPSIMELTDLPVGWYAWRDAKGSTWKRDKYGYR